MLKAINGIGKVFDVNLKLIQSPHNAIISGLIRGQPISYYKYFYTPGLLHTWN